MTEKIGPYVPISSRRKRTIQMARDGDTDDDVDTKPLPTVVVDEFVVFVAECSRGSATRMFAVNTRQLEDELMDIDHLLDDPKAEHAFDDDVDMGVIARIGRRLGLAGDADDDGDLMACEVSGGSFAARIRCVIRGSCDQ